MRARTVAMLLAGRGVARLGQYVTGFALLAVWGPTIFARYAAALGVGAWLFVLAVAGIERAALVLVGAGGGRLEPLFAWLGAAPFAATLAAWAALAVTLPGHAAVAYAAGLAFMAGSGSVAVLVGLFRLRGRPGVDAAAFATLSAGYGLALLLGAIGGVGVDGVLASLVLTVTAVNVVLLTWLRPTLRPAVHRAAEPARVLRTIGLLATGEVAGGLVGSAMYAVLAARAPAEQSSIYYVCAVASSACGVVAMYLMRLWQPDLLRWVAAHAEAARARLRRGLLVTAVAGAVLGAGSAVPALRSGGTVHTAAIALGAEVVVYVAVAVLAFVIESMDERDRVRSAVSAVVSMASVALFGWLLIPIAGAAGAMVAWSVGWVLRSLLLRRDRAVRGAITAQPRSSDVDA